MTIFYEGEPVHWTGSPVQAEGHIVALAGGNTAAHVKWASGPDAGHMTVVDLYDIEPVTASKVEEDPFHLTAVRRAYDDEREAGVLNFLASNEYLDSWTGLAKDVLIYVEDRLRRDASMELVDEQLTAAEAQQVVKTAALTLLRDAFGIEEGE